MHALIAIVHVFSLALGVGAATVKCVLLWKAQSDVAFARVYLRVARPITRVIIIGLILLTVSGIVWMVMIGQGFTPLLIAKLILVASIWVIGPIIDTVMEPRFRKSLPADGQSPSPAYVRAQKQFLALEVVATTCFYAATVMGVLL